VGGIVSSDQCPVYCLGAEILRPTQALHIYNVGLSHIFSAHSSATCCLKSLFSTNELLYFLSLREVYGEAIPLLGFFCSTVAL
jgi:hypothetical protein